MAKTECTQCGEPNEPGSRFCIRCGASMEPKVRCPACQHLQALGNQYCMSCGSEMEGASWQPSAGESMGGAVIEGVWERPPEEFIRRVDPEDMRTVLGNRVLRVPPGTAGFILVDGVVERVLPPGQQTTISLFERIAHFFTREHERTAFYLVDLRPIPVPFTVNTRPTAAGRTVQTQVLVSFSLQRGDKQGLAAFIGNVLGSRPAFGARDLYQLLRPEVARLAGLILERLADAGELRYSDAEAEIRRELAQRLAPRYGLAVDVTVAPLTTTASLNFQLGTGQAPAVRACAECAAEIPASLRFCDRCGARQPALLSPDRRCTQCDSQVPASDHFCNRCGADYHAPPATAAPLFTADGEQVEVDLVVRVQGQHQDFAPASIAPALAGGVAAYLREQAFSSAATSDGFSSMEGAVRGDVEAHLSSYGLSLIALTVIDIRAKRGQWLLGARADIERARSEVLLGREWLQQRAEEVDLAELSFAQILRQRQVESAARLRELALELTVAQRERGLRSDDQFARDRASLDDRARRQDLSVRQAELDALDAERAAERDVRVARAERSVDADARDYARDTELEDLGHQVAKERTALEHQVAQTRTSMALDAEQRRQESTLQSERARRAADDAAYASRAHDGAAHEDRARRAELEQSVADREQARQLEKLRAMTELDKELAEQEHAHKRELRESLRGLSEAEMIAAQASELAKSEGGGAAWAQAVASQDKLEQAERHAQEVKDLMQGQTAAMQEMMKDQLDRMQSLTERVLDRSAESASNAAAARVYETSVDAMSRVAASRAAPPAVAVTAALAKESAEPAGKACAHCGAVLRADAGFCGSCGQKQ